MLMLGDGSLSDGEDSEEDDMIIGLSKLLFVVFMVGINVFMLNLMINLMDDFMCVKLEAVSTLARLCSALFFFRLQVYVKDGFFE